MPHLLRFDAIRLLEAAKESLGLAVGSLGAQKRIEFRQPAAKFALEIGLVGAAAELGMAACLVQALGATAILRPSGQYKTAGVLLSEFRDLVKQATASSSFLTEGVPEPEKHRDELMAAALGFKLLIPVRAGGLHAGRGLLHEATVAQANAVADFLELLAQSRRLHPYLDRIPRCLWYGRDRLVLIEDLQAKLEEAAPIDQPTILSSIYLVLPDVPEEEPEWLDALSRVSVAPRKRDVEFLLESLQEALPAALRRAGKGGRAVPVRVDGEDPGALPIAPQFLRRQFNQIPDLWHADIATANGRLEQGALDLPPLEAVIDVFAIGLVTAGILEEGEQLGPHQAWPHVLASLGFPGTPGPYWFLVRRCDDLGQLRALLNRASKGDGRLKERLRECLDGIELLRNGTAARRDSPVFGSLVAEVEAVQGDRERLRAREAQHRNNARALPAELRGLLGDVAEDREAVGSLIKAMLNEERSSECMTYWPRVLAESASRADDVPGLVSVLGTETAKAGHTAARKALRRIDFSLSGPSID